MLIRIRRDMLTIPGEVFVDANGNGTFGPDEQVITRDGDAWWLDSGDDPYDGPIAQVNLLKFRVNAEYRPHDPEFGADEPGSAAYMRYAKAFGVIAAEVGGAPLLIGEVERYFIGNGDWDAVMVMRFPSRAAFIATLNHDVYAAISRHRDAGLLCQELLTTRP